MSGATIAAAAGAGLLLALLASEEGGSAGSSTAGPYGAAVAAAARKSLGVKETAPNNGPEIAAWAAELGLVPPLQWCGVAVSHWLREASKATGLPLVVPGAGRAKALLQQFQQRGRALSAEQARARTLSPGTVLVWDRATKPGGPEGHTGVVERDNGASWTTIEGNTEGNDVRRVQRPKNDPRLLGAGLVDAGPAKPAQGPVPSPQRPPATPGPTPGPVPPQGPAPAGARVLVAGDSLGVGLTFPLITALAPRTVLGFGVNGTTVGQWAAATGPLAPLLAALAPGDLALLSLGTNDIAAQRDAKTVGADAAQLIAFLQAAGARVGWIAPPSLSGPKFERQYPIRNQLENACMAQGAPLFDSELIEFQRAPDGIHATPTGYAQWAAQIATWAKQRGLV